MHLQEKEQQALLLRRPGDTLKDSLCFWECKGMTGSRSLAKGRAAWDQVGICDV